MIEDKSSIIANDKNNGKYYNNKNKEMITLSR